MLTSSARRLALLHSIAILSPFFSKSCLKFTKSCKNEIYLQEIIKSRNVCCSLSSCSRYNVNFKLVYKSLFAIMALNFDINQDDHPRTVTHARDHWRTLDFANAFLSSGGNSRAELVPSHGAPRRLLGVTFNLKLVFH